MSQQDMSSAYRLVKLRQKDPNSKLGFSLRGGKEATGSSVGVFVSHIEPQSQASQIGLRVGDQLIQVNGLQVSQATYEEVIGLIKQTPRCDHICLLVNYVGRVPFQEKAGEPIGWLLVGQDNHNDNGRQDSPIAPKCEQRRNDSPEGQRELNSNGESPTTANLNADKSDSMNHPDLDNQMCPANNFESATQANYKSQKGRMLEKADSYLQDADSAASSKSFTFTSSSGSSCASSKDDEDEDEIENEPEKQDDACLQLTTKTNCCRGSSSSSAASTSSGCSISMSSVQSGQSTELCSAAVDQHNDTSDTPVRVPGGRRTSEPFGCGVVKGPDEWPGIFVQNVKRDSLAERVGLELGDQLIRAEHYELSEMSFDEAINTIKRLQQQQDELLLVVRKGAALKHLAKCKQHQVAAEAKAVATSASQPTKSASSDGYKRNNNNNNEDLKLQKVVRGVTMASNETDKSQAKCQPPRMATRRKPLEPPPAPPIRRNQQAATCDMGANSAKDGQVPEFESHKVEHSKGIAAGGRLANSISPQRTTTTKKSSETPVARRQQAVKAAASPSNSNHACPGDQSEELKQKHNCPCSNANLNACEQHELDHRRPKTISEPISRMPPTDRTVSTTTTASAQNQLHTAGRLATAVATNLQTAKRSESPERAHLTVAPGAAAARPERPSGLTGTAEKSTVQQSRQQQQQRQLKTQPDEQSRLEDCEPTGPEADESIIDECCNRRRVPPLSRNANRDEEQDGDDSDAQSSSLSSSINRDSNQSHHENQDRNLRDKNNKTNKMLCNQSLRTTEKSFRSKVMIDCASDDDQEQAPNGCEHDEEIRIVKQNCKLHHHNSIQSLVKSKMFLQQQQQLSSDCHNHNNYYASSRPAPIQSDLSSARRMGASSNETKSIHSANSGNNKTRLVSSKNYRAPQVPSGAVLQRYISVDNLNLQNMHSNYSSRRNEFAIPTSGNSRLKRLAHQMTSNQVGGPLLQQQQQQLSGYQVMMSHTNKLALQSRSSSVLGQSVMSRSATPTLVNKMNPLVCCPISHHQRRQYDDDQLVVMRRHQQQQQQLYQQQSQLMVGSSQAGRANCCLMLACLNNGQQQHYQQPLSIGAAGGLIRPAATMKHLHAAATTTANGTAKSATSGAGKLFRQQCSNTLALAKFKARSEDKLNLMNINLNYVKIGSSSQQQFQKQQQIASRHLLRLQQARHQQQSRILAANSAAKRHHDLRQLIDQAELTPVPNCCVQPQQMRDCLRDDYSDQLARSPQSASPAAAAAAAAATVYNYATATGMISQTRKVSPLARSCCAIDRMHQKQDAFEPVGPLGCGSHEVTTNDLFDLMMQKQKNQQQRKMKSFAANTCYEYGCCCPATTPSQCQSQSSKSSHRSMAPSQQASAKSKHLVSVDANCTNNGATTDSSGYQSASEAVRRRNLALVSNQNCDSNHKSQPAQIKCCQYDSPRSAQNKPTSRSPQRVEQCQTKHLSTFSAKPVANQRHLQTTQSSSPTIQVSTSSGSCGLSSISSTATSSPSSLSPSSCSPLSSPGRRYLSSTSSASSAADLVAPTPPAPKQNEPTGGGNKSRLFKRRTAASSTGASQQCQDVKSKSIPRPPPMPLDDRTLPTSGRSEASQSQAARTRACQQKQQQQLAATESDASTLVQQSNKFVSASDSNKLCFVDELKMLASQQQRHGKSGQAHFGANTNGGNLLESASHVDHQLGDSSTLIKLINANKAATSGARRPNETRSECSCCQASDCSLASKLDNAAEDQTGDSGCRKFGCTTTNGGVACRTRPTKASHGDQPSKSVQLRNEEDNKRRQHELLMEEFKTAHSKMFNRLRQVSNNDGKQKQQRTHTSDSQAVAPRDVDGETANHGGENNDSPNPTGKISDGNINLANIRPRPTVATN